MCMGKGKGKDRAKKEALSAPSFPTNNDITLHQPTLDTISWYI